MKKEVFFRKFSITNIECVYVKYRCECVSNKSRFSNGILKKVSRISATMERNAIGYKKAKTNRNWVQILHFYHAKTVNTDMRRIHVPNTNLGRHERN